jgi:lysophospholipase L1-like esterase
MISRPNIATNPTEFAERRDVVINTYRHAKKLGDRNVYYIDGESFFLGKYENECTMDGVHPNDLGFTLMADGIESEIRRALRNSAESGKAKESII